MIHLRKANPSDLDLLLHWDRQPHVKEAIPDEYWNWEVELNRDPEWREQLIAEWEGRPIGFIQIIDPHLEETHYWGDVPANKRALDIWIGEAKDLNQGFGSQMMHAAIQRCFAESEVDAILIDPLASNSKAIRFYERLGFVFVEDREFDGTPCKVYALRWENYQR